VANRNKSCLVRRHFRLRDANGNELRRSIALEPGFWSALDDMAPGDKLRELIEHCLTELSAEDSLVSILRCTVLKHYRALCNTRHAEMKLSEAAGKERKQPGMRS
tara:strand:- start:276 stop:590 length:315 start_codon:yes stop_codon:yes gene_type:complete